jgi:O-antigen ligase
MRAITYALSLAFVFTIPWEGVEVSGLGTIAKPLGFVVALLWLATVVITGKLRKPGPFQVLVLLFVLWSAISVFWSADPGNSVGHVMTWTQLLVLVFILWDLYTTQTAVVAGLQAYVLGAWVAIGSAVANYLAGNAYYTHYDRFSSGDTNPDGFGFILALGIPVAWYLASRKSTSKIETILKVVNYAYLPAALIGISLSGTRTALVATIPGMAFGLASLTRLRLWARTAIFLALSLAVLLVLPYLQTLTSFQRFSTTTTELTQGTLNERTDIWSDGFDSFAEHPLIGVGTNMFRSVNRLGKVAHNSFISVLVEVGLIGLALFGLILTFTFFEVLRQPKWEKRLWLTLLLVWGIGASTLTWEYRKSTWLFLSLVIVSAAIARQRNQAATLAQRDVPEIHFVPHPKHGTWPQGAEGRPYLG